MGGAEHYCMRLCKELSSLGHEVYILSSRHDENVPGNIRCVKVPVNTRSSSTKNLSFHQNCQKILRQMQFDWTYALSRTFPADAFRISDPLHARWMKIRYPGRFMRKIQELNPRHRAILFLEKSIFDARNTRVVITNSKMVKRQVIEEYGFPAERIHVVYNGVDLDKFSPGTSIRTKSREDDELNLLFVAMDFKRKGLDFLLESLAKLRKTKTKFKLLVAGKDKRGRYAKKARALGLEQAVRFLGEIRNVEDYYRAADLFVLPTRYDPFANVCLEAMACGTPVVTTINNGAAELIEDGTNGYVIRHVDRVAEELAEIIRVFSRLPGEKKSEMRTKARLKAEKFSIRENAARTVNLFMDEVRKRNEKHQVSDS